MSKKKSKADPDFDPKQGSKQGPKKGPKQELKQAKNGKAVSKKKPRYNYSGDIKKPDKKHATRSSKTPGFTASSTSQQSQDNRNDESDDDFMSPPPQPRSSLYLYPAPPRPKPRSTKFKKPNKNVSAYSSDENDVDELISSGQDQSDEDSIDGSSENCESD